MKKIVQVILLLVPFYILRINVALYHSPDCEEQGNGIVNEEVLAQLHFLKDELHHKNAGRRMQRFFPEGFVFINALYGLSWCEIAKDFDPKTDLYQEALEEIDFAIRQIESDYGKSIFTQDLAIEYGAFYQGWRTYLQGKRLEISVEKDPVAVRNFKNACEQIKKGFESTDRPYLRSFHYGTWPADHIGCIAALSVHDKVFKSEYQSIIKRRVDLMKENLDPMTGLIPHEYMDGDEFRLDARGSSQSLILSHLYEIDPDLGREHFEIYKEHFLEYRLGLPGIREYRRGVDKYGDVDSGPVIWGIGGAASVVGVRTLGLYGETTAYKGMRNSLQGFGCAFRFNGKKRYIFGQLPMADAFIAWSNAVNCRVSQDADFWWRFPFQILSLLIGSFVVYLVLKI